MESPATSINADPNHEAVPTALIIGSGYAASLTCLELQALGFKVCILQLPATNSEDIFCSAPDVDIDALKSSSELAMNGAELFVLGQWPTISRDETGFSIGLGQLKHRRFDTLFFSGSPGLSSGNSCFSHLAGPYSPGEIDGTHPQDIAFLFDYPFPSDPAVGMSAFSSAIKNSTAGGKSSVIFRNAPVRNLMGETLYDQAKNSGVMFYRYVEDSIDVSRGVSSDSAGDRIVIGFHDVIETGQKVELACDKLFMVSRADFNGIPQNMRRFLGADIDANGFLVSESIHCNTFRSFNSGVYCVGGFTGTLGLGAIISQAKSAAVNARAYASDAKSKTGNNVMMVSDECVRCLTCHRICPHAAIWPISAPSRSRLLSIPNACMECGICVSECPRKALEIKHFPEEAFAGFLDDIKSQNNKIVVYGCSRSAGRSVANIDLPPDVIFFSVPCAGRVSESVILDTIASGARGVLVIGCHHGNCESNNGTDWACDRVKSVITNFLSPMNLASVIQYNTTAPNEAKKLERIISQFAARLRVE